MVNIIKTIPYQTVVIDELLSALTTEFCLHSDNTTLIYTLGPCKIEMMSESGLTNMKTSEVYFLVSMSRDRVQTDPKKTIRKLATKLIRTLTQQVSFATKYCYRRKTN